MTRRANPWFSLGWDAFTLGVEASAVIGLRSMKIAAGGTAANAEAELMIREKVDAAMSLQTLAMTGALGLTAPRIAAKTLAHYRRKVRSNRRRLSKAP